MKNSIIGVLIIFAIFCVYLNTKLLCFPSAVCICLIISITLFSQCDANCILMLLDIFGKNTDSLKGKVIWITGASSGIGKACAIKFSELKCKIVLSARRKDLLEEVKEECIKKGNLTPDDVIVLPLDIKNHKLHEEYCETVIKHFGEIDILLSNAAVAQNANFETITMDVELEIFKVNVFGLVNLAREVTKHFLAKKRGHHVVVSSIAGKYGLPRSSSYSGSKFALHGIFESLRAQHGSKGIDVTMLDIGAVTTDIEKNLYGSKMSQRGIPAQNRKKLRSNRVATLISVATMYKLCEVYIAQQPELLFLYFITNFSCFFQWIMHYIDFYNLTAKLRRITVYERIKYIEEEVDEEKITQN